MLSRKRLRERLDDICVGAGYIWMYDSFYEANDGEHLKTVANVIEGIGAAFDIPWDSTFFRVSSLDNYNDRNDMLNHVYRTLMSLSDE